MTARDDILAAARSLEQRGLVPWSPAHVLRRLTGRGRPTRAAPCRHTSSRGSVLMLRRTMVTFGLSSNELVAASTDSAEA